MAELKKVENKIEVVEEEITNVKGEIEALPVGNGERVPLQARLAELQACLAELEKRLNIYLQAQVAATAQPPAAQPGAGAGAGAGAINILGPALIAGALLVLTPPAYAMGKVANQGSEYMTSLGHPPKAGMGVFNSAWKWVNKQAAAGAGVVAAFGVAVLMKRPRSGSRQSTPRTTYPAGPPSPA
eukprot:CAMPEP_0202860612 /NCGR_PEP_ID=MMETSP1391-20130828/2263_1 /ASSEMBLY_ACC=CAM_ASM_000867 /TAXON_ID=1034604 /ORGANISM="Chlamydomonas leiostraca, Strain SAG 11-49" /LENGTH=184 /DNA_ID=CAMNT_0049539821 /DNA_START=30 /DNA_END=584 /DNA_ORIENTATION=-